MRNASFIYTEAQIRDGTKDITRRLEWLWAKPGMRVMACRKCMGRKAGEPLVRIREIEIVSVRREHLDALLNRDEYNASMAQQECNREGFPELTPAQFVAMFCKHMNCHPHRFVTRVEFKYVNAQAERIAA